MKLYKHQQAFADKNPDRAMLVWETGTGKTISACVWMKARPNIKMLVSCPKGIIGKWRRDLKEWNVTNADVCSRDEVKKIDLKNYGGLVLDEAQDFSSPLFTKQRSARTTVIYNYIKIRPRAMILLLTATPVRSTPWNIHTLACYLGTVWDKGQFLHKFFHMTDKFGVRHYEKNDGWQSMIRPYVESISDIVLMSDCVDVPQQFHKVVNVKWEAQNEKKLQKQMFEENIVVEWHARHRAEQSGNKWRELKKILDGHRKVIVVCHYRDQIDDYVKRIGDNRLVYVLNGDTKDQDAVIEGAKSADDCVFIIQAQMGAGFDAGEFSVVVFASIDFKYISMVQMKGRVKRINNLHENTFIYLMGGKCDRSVYNTIMTGKDFDPHEYMKKEKYDRSKNKEVNEQPF